MCDICLTHFLEEDTDIPTCSYVDYVYFNLGRTIRIYYCDECISKVHIYQNDLPLKMYDKLKEVNNV